MKNSKPTILLVEDDAILRETLTLYLKVNSNVIPAESGEVAIEKVGNSQHIDIVLTDFNLRNRMDGLNVLQATRKLFPKVPVLLMTGSNPSLPRVQELLTHEHTVFLEKPFPLDELDKKIEAILLELRGPSEDLKI